MNLSPEWADLLAGYGWTAKHWISVGDPRATDRTILDWAREHKFVLLTQDLDFGTLLALTRASGPSVFLIRFQDVLPKSLGTLVVETLRTHAASLESGALVVLDETRARVRVLPIAS